MISILQSIKRTYPDCAITLSIGEKSEESYACYRKVQTVICSAMETANRTHYEKLHPPTLSFDHRRQCLYTLKALGYSVGCGFMVGSPYQTAECLAEDMMFMQELQPQMVGIGPFIPHHDTPFAQKPGGTLETTLRMLALTRLLLPKALLPATTALTNFSKRPIDGLVSRCQCGNAESFPVAVRDKYLLYDHKAFTGLEAAESLEQLKMQVSSLVYHVVVDRGIRRYEWECVVALPGNKMGSYS